MATVEKSITVNVPVRAAYNQWTQFEEFPQFMEGVKRIQQLDDKRLLWRAQIGPKEEEWQAEIMEQIPDQRIAWRSTSGAENGGVVTFHRLDENTTRVMLQMEYDPEGMVENVGDKLGFVTRRVEGDLERFKKFIEARGQETGAWRGEIHGDRVQAGGAQSAMGGGSQGMPGGAGSSNPGSAGPAGQQPAGGRASKRSGGKSTGGRAKKSKNA